VSLVLNHRRTNAKVLSSIKESAVVYRNSELSKSLYHWKQELLKKRIPSYSIVNFD